MVFLGSCPKILVYRVLPICKIMLKHETECLLISFSAFVGQRRKLIINFRVC
jgi:hypothetical protein